MTRRRYLDAMELRANFALAGGRENRELAQVRSITFDAERPQHEPELERAEPARQRETHVAAVGDETGHRLRHTEEWRCDVERVREEDRSRTLSMIAISSLPIDSAGSNPNAPQATRAEGDKTTFVQIRAK